MPIVRFQPRAPDKTTTGAIGAMALWAGESVGAAKSIQSAAEIVRELVEEAERHRPHEERTVMGAAP